MGKRRKRTRNKKIKTVRIEGYGISHAVIDEAQKFEFPTGSWNHPDTTAADIIRDIQRVRDSYRRSFNDPESTPPVRSSAEAR